MASPCACAVAGCGAPNSSRSFASPYAVETRRITNTTERLHEEFRRRVKTQGSLSTEDAALGLRFRLVTRGQIELRDIDGWQKIGGVLNKHTAVAAR